MAIRTRVISMAVRNAQPVHRTVHPHVHETHGSPKSSPEPERPEARGQRHVGTSRKRCRLVDGKVEKSGACVSNLGGPSSPLQGSSDDHTTSETHQSTNERRNTWRERREAFMSAMIAVCCPPPQRGMRASQPQWWSSAGTQTHKHTLFSSPLPSLRSHVMEYPPSS
ncbi:uncharacterized protein [Physcomitrium patens]|uniref:uncharacterized protein n=1 Tax=Physcomitrium patens TaxID=3218 RepID=UPI003CCCFBED